MRALVTGAGGFVGSHLTRELIRRGAEVAILRRATTDLWRLGNALNEVTQIEGDLLTLSTASKKIFEFSPDTIFHLAWHGVGNQDRNNPEQFSENLQASVNIIQLALAAKCRTFVAVGSQAEYGPHDGVINEQTFTRPTTTYGAAKLSACLLSQQLLLATGIRFVWLRLFSCYGPRDNPDWMIPYLITSLRSAGRPSLTLAEQRWDYLFVADAAEAIYLAASTPEASGVFNLGSGRAVALREIIEYVRDLIDPNMPLGFGELPYRADQVMHLQADVEKLREATGWFPRTTLYEGLERTVEWHVRNTGVAANE